MEHNSAERRAVIVFAEKFFGHILKKLKFLKFLRNKFDNNILYCGFTSNSPAAPYYKIRQDSRSLIRCAHSPARSLWAHIAPRLYYCSALRASPFLTRFYEARISNTQSHKNRLLCLIDAWKRVYIISHLRERRIAKKNCTWTFFHSTNKKFIYIPLFEAA